VLSLNTVLQAVFGAYGIGVDPRHLGLIADFMTHTGGYRCAHGTDLCCSMGAAVLLL
jgi:DNA-directed RNA polymerase I subunit RPA1